VPREYCGIFKYKENAIKAYKPYEVDGGYVYVFFDSSFYYDEERDYTERMEKDKTKYNLKTFNEDRKKFGMLAIKTNFNTFDEKEIFEKYKTR
jgi:hypothetical protein